MIKKSIVLVAVSLSAYAALYGHEPPVLSSWIPANPMNKARSFFAAAELPNGNILVAGGFDSGVNFAESEIYDWHTGVWTPTASMKQARSAPVAVQLENGRVMVIGGFDEKFNVLDSAEIYDPRTNTWSLIKTAHMNDARFEDFVAVWLPGRKVLVAGGFTSTPFLFFPLKSAEIFDEKTGTWSPTSPMNVHRGEFANVKLLDGRVLVMGGTTVDLPQSPTATAEIFDPKTQQWSFTGSMITGSITTGREDHAAVLLRDGRVLVAGGTTSEDSPRFTSAEIFDPKTGNWSPTGSMHVGRSEIEYAAVRLPDGRVLVPGGYSAPHTPTNTADLFDPKTGTWAAAGLMNAARAGHAAIVLRGNRGVLVMGGLMGDPTDSIATTSVDIFQVAPLP